MRRKGKMRKLLCFALSLQIAASAVVLGGCNRENPQEVVNKMPFVKPTNLTVPEYTTAD